MNNIKDFEKLNARQLETLRRKNAREISRTEQAHEDYKADLKKAHDAEIVDLRHENERQLMGENDKKEKVLHQMKHHLDETARLTDRQVKEIKTQASKTKMTEAEKLSMERDRIKAEHDLHMEDMSYRHAKDIRQVSHANQKELNKLQEVKHAEISTNREHFDDRLQSQTKEFNTRFQTDATNYRQMKETQDKTFKKERMSTNLRQQEEMGKMTKTHQDHLEVKDQNYRKGLKDQDLFFEKKYEKNLAKNNGDLKNLADVNAKVLTKMQTELNQKIDFYKTRQSDPFYQFTELRPTLKEYPDRVEISVEVPDHSKQDMALTLNNKEAVLTFNRRYQDSRKDGNVTNRMNKIESFTTRLATSHHLDPKSVKSSYENGVMTYVIKAT